MTHNPPTALIIEDDLDLAHLIATHLKGEGYLVRVVHDIRQAIPLLQESSLGLAIIDRNLPDGDGIEVCRRIRELTPQAGIIMLTCLGQTQQRIEGLGAGADDYVTKPFSVDELIARVRSVARRSSLPPTPPPSDSIKILDLEINTSKRTVTLRGELIDLTDTEYRILLLLARAPGRAFSRSELLHNVWGYTLDGYEHTISTHITRLRAKLHEDLSSLRYILTVWGVGYKFADCQTQENDQ